MNVRGATLAFTAPRLSPISAHIELSSWRCADVVNMWKYYNHQYLERQTRENIQNLLWYTAFVGVLIYGITFLPPPAVMLRHQNAVSDLLLGEEFPAETTHILKTFHDVGTAQEMWQWATGPLADALLVESLSSWMAHNIMSWDHCSNV